MRTTGISSAPWHPGPMAAERQTQTRRAWARPRSHDAGAVHVDGRWRKQQNGSLWAGSSDRVSHADDHQLQKG